jgi:hypothetical protein
MPDEVYQMVPGIEKEKYEPYLMTPLTGEPENPEVYLMNPTGQPMPPGGPNGGPFGETIWTLYDVSKEFRSDYATTTFNNTPGDWTGVSPAYIVTAPFGYTKVKIVGFNGAWTYSAAPLYCGSLWLKSAIQAQLAGSGSLYGSTVPAAAEWASVIIEINLGADRKFGWGYNNPSPVAGAWYLQFRVYLA